MNEKEAREIIDTYTEDMRDSRKYELDISYQMNGAKAQGYLEALEKAKVLEGALDKLLGGIIYASVEVLNGKYVKFERDYEDAYKNGAHTFFKLIGKVYPDAKDALAKWEKEK